MYQTMDFNNGPKLTKSGPKKLINWTKKLTKNKNGPKNMKHFGPKLTKNKSIMD